MSAQTKLEQEEKKVLLLKMKYILQQIEHLEQELKSVVRLNRKLSSLSFTESLTVLNKTDPEIVRLKKEFSRFSEKNQERSSKALMEIHSGVKKLLNIQLQRMMEFSEQELPIDKALIVKTAQAIRKSSKTILAIESLLSQRGEQSYDPINLSETNQTIEEKIDYIDNKENTLHTTIKIIEHVSPKGEQNGEYQALIEHLKAGGSLDEIESKFHVEKIDIKVNEEVALEEQAPQSVQQPPSRLQDVATEAEVLKQSSEKPIDQQPQPTIPFTVSQKCRPSAFQLFWQVFRKWLNTPAEVNWKIAKQQVLEKYHQQ